MAGLNDMGYDPTETECPKCDDGELWVNSFELVCSDCGSVLRKGESTSRDFSDNRDERPTYDSSGRVILPGGFFGAYRGDGLYGSGEK
jgi:hypothetical protein